MREEKNLERRNEKWSYLMSLDGQWGRDAYRNAKGEIIVEREIFYFTKPTNEEKEIIKKN